MSFPSTPGKLANTFRCLPAKDGSVPNAGGELCPMYSQNSGAVETKRIHPRCQRIKTRAPLSGVPVTCIISPSSTMRQQRRVASAIPGRSKLPGIKALLWPLYTLLSQVTIACFLCIVYKKYPFCLSRQLGKLDWLSYPAMYTVLEPEHMKIRVKVGEDLIREASSIRTRHPDPTSPVHESVIEQQAWLRHP
ncbi:hypothetical protein LZ32DRAFT_61354 [Colletotrichum eremochloae]|nr:hypothetical protein LZ32DRAFT_61354 [Colletotrichum eremochloae]